jgi:uncharacterized protein with PIN domain
MLGTLAKWLRILGADTLFFRDADDRDLLRVAREEGRVLLTRDRPLAAGDPSGASVHLVREESLEEQLREVVQAFGIRPGEAGFTRCSVCNVPLEPMDVEEARPRVPPYVARTQSRFLRCAGCDRVYWAATHVEAMRRRLRELLGEE